MRLIRILVGLACVGAIAWMVLTLVFSPIAPPALRTPLAGLIALGAVVGAVFLRPFWRFAGGTALVFAIVLGAFLALSPSNERDWQPDVARLPRAEVQGDRLVVRNVRNNEYRSETDYTVRYEDREYDLSQLRSLDLFLIYWGSPLIAHTIMSWGFEVGQYLAFSIETRKEVGEEYSAVKGFFRNYEILYIAADERDVVRLRSNFRGEDVYVYRLDVPAQGPRLLLLAYLDAANALVDEPRWYNALTHNCTTTIQHLAAPFEQRSWTSWRMLANGYLDELAYDIGAVDRTLPFPELKKRSWINDRAKAAGADPQFSLRIRAGVPGMTEAP